MLRRNNSKSRPSLGRSKSNASVRSAVENLEYINPATALRDAHLAANLSFSRAGHSPTGSGKGFGLLPEVPESSDHMDDSGGGSSLGRRRSVRFVRAPPGGRQSAASLANVDMSLASTQPSARPLSQASSLATPLADLAADVGYLQALQAAEDYYTPEDDVASAPSSFRRLRKSKSMVAQTRPDYISSSGGSPTHQGFRSHTLRNSLSSDKENCRPSSEIIPSLRAPKSMTFLAGGRHHAAPPPAARLSRQDNDLAVEMARAIFQESIEQQQEQQQQQRLRSRPSRFFGSRSRRSKSAADLRRSVRGSSLVDEDDPPGFESVDRPRKGLMSTARKVSTSLKNKLRRFLGRTGKTQTEPSTTAHGDPLCETGGENRVSIEEDGPDADTTTVRHSADECPIVHVPARTPSFHEIPVEDQLRSRKGSMDTLKSERRPSEEKSRVTSWTSSGGDTLPSHTLEWEKQRLSVINETGAHVSSTSRPRTILGELVPTDGPEGGTGLDSRIHSGPGRIIDSDRVYSALMKREQEVLPDRCDSHRSIHNEELVGQQTLTVRLVTSEDDVFVDEYKKVVTQIESCNASHGLGSRTPSTGSVIVRKQPRTTPVQSTPEDSAVGPSERTQAGPSSEAASPNNDAPGESDGDHLFRGSSAYRLALQEKMKVSLDGNDLAVRDFAYLPSMSNLSLPLRCPSEKTSEGERRRLDYTSSIYSSVANSPEAPRSLQNAPPVPQSTAVQTLVGEGSSDEVLAPRTYFPRHETGRSPPSSSSSSSTEWMAMLSADISKFESLRSASGRPQPVRFAMPKMPKSMGHVREATEIEPSGGFSSPAAYRPSGATAADPDLPAPLQPVEVNTISSVSSSGRRAFRLSGRPGTSPVPVLPPPGGENVDPVDLDLVTGQIGEPSPTPPIPPRNPLRGAPSLPALRSDAHKASMDLSRVQSHGSQTIPKIRSMSTMQQPPHGCATPPDSQQPLVGGSLKCYGNHGYSMVSRRPSLPRPHNRFSTGSPLSKAEWKAAAPSTPHVTDGCNTSSPGAMSSAQSMGSGRMVDLFLSSRRRRSSGAKDTDAFV